MDKSKRQNTESEQSDRKVIQELRSTVRRQQKEIIHLKKQLLLSEESSPEQPKSNEEDRSVICPICGNPAKETDLGRLVLLSCRFCKWKTKKK